MKRPLKPVTDADVNRALSLLRDHPSGVTREHLAVAFADDRKGRKIIESLVATGRAAVINTEDVLGNNVYRLARTTEEVESEARKLASYQESLERRRQGLLEAWKRGGTHEPQKGLF
jgi:nitroreductase